MKNFLKKQWFGIISLIIGSVLSTYTYVAAKVDREPVFISDQIKTLIVDGQKSRNKNFHIVDADGNDVRGDIVAVKFSLWNEGRQSIKNSEILESLQITVKGNQVKILDQHIIASTRRKIVNPSISKINENTVNVNFNILEKNDGFSGQIIYNGDKTAEIEFTGEIEGVTKSQIIRENDLERRMFWRWYFPIVGIFCATILIGILAIVIFTRITNLINEKLKITHKTKFQKLAKPFGVTAAGLFFLVYVGLITNATVKGKSGQQIPNELKEALVHASKAPNPVSDLTITSSEVPQNE